MAPDPGRISVSGRKDSSAAQLPKSTRSLRQVSLPLVGREQGWGFSHPLRVAPFNPSPQGREASACPLPGERPALGVEEVDVGDVERGVEGRAQLQFGGAFELDGDLGAIGDGDVGQGVFAEMLEHFERA